MSTPRDQWTAIGFLKSAAIGAVTAGVVGLAAAPLIKKSAPRITAKITGGGKGGGGRAAAPVKNAGEI